MEENLVSLTDLIESRLRKQQEIDYYQEVLTRLQKKIGDLSKEVNITTLIIDMIENESVLTIDKKRGKILLLNSRKEII